MNHTTPAEITPILKAHREAMALELRALSLWVDIQNAAQFLGRQHVEFADDGGNTHVKPDICVVIGADEYALVGAFATVARAVQRGHLHMHGARGPIWILAAETWANGVRVTVQSQREPTREELSGVAE